MRQAGRYMAAYRRLRERHELLDMFKTPELAVQVTLQPVHALAVDAAIIFADILPPLEGMGLNLQFVEGEGPVIDNPVRTAADVERLRVLAPEETLPFTLEAIRLVCRELAPRGLPLLGFSGAPFTLAAYAIEGGSSRNFLQVKSFMHREPAAWHALMTKLSEVVGEYLLAQTRSGAQALQLFDSWAGQLSPEDYRHCVRPYTQRALAIARPAGVPLIHFGTDTAGMLEDFGAAGSDVVGIDWRIDLDVAWQRLGGGVAIQGNLDPAALLLPWDALRPIVERLLDQADRRAGHIFNLGHGILPTTPEDNVRRVIDHVHSYAAR
jgi:uroporphyrinogen decarboxylase